VQWRVGPRVVERAPDEELPSDDRDVASGPGAPSHEGLPARVGEHARREAEKLVEPAIGVVEICLDVSEGELLERMLSSERQISRTRMPQRVVSDLVSTVRESTPGSDIVSDGIGKDEERGRHAEPFEQCRPALELRRPRIVEREAQGGA
jgi:hypothetical protein